jgi:two-component system sensor histidine kinase/response regulator
LNEQSVDAAALVHDCIQRFEKLVQEKGIELSVIAPPGGAPLVGDSAKLGRILQNLLHNAIKFTPAKKKIDVKIANAPQHDAVESEIADTGAGMPEQHIDRMFQPFQQMDSSLRRQFSGLGLGLAVARRLTDFLGGSLQIKSRPDIGTHVLLSIPSHPASAAGESAGHVH